MPGFRLLACRSSTQCRTAAAERPIALGSGQRQQAAGLVPPAEKSNAAVADDTRIPVSEVRITGNTVFSEAQLQALIAPELAEGEVKTVLPVALLAGTAGACRAHHHVLPGSGLPARPRYLPAQEVRDGRLEIGVLEGRVSRINWNNESRHADAALEGRLDEVPLDAPLYNLIA